MDLAEARQHLRALRDAGTFDTHDTPVAAMLVLEHLAAIDRRAAQVRGGLKPYARPPEIVDYLLAEPPS